MFQNDQPEADVPQALVSQLNNNIQSGIQKRGRRDHYLGFCNSYCKPSLAAEQEAICKKTTDIALEKAADAFNKTMEMEAKSCKKSIADAVNAEKEKVAEQEATCKETTAIAVEKEVGLCKKTTAIAVKKEAESCKKSISNAVNVEKE